VYIASDDIQHPLCQSLIEKYNMKIYEADEVDTIMFGSTCKQIILTGGSFSFCIGLFGFDSKVFYLRVTGTWHPPELFSIGDWTEITV
jgi:hypothetical protein